MHLYLCPNPTIAIAREKSFHQILNWLETAHTDPILLEIITSFWHEKNLVLDPECPQVLKSMYNTLRDKGLHQMWLGFLPVGMVDYRETYYQQIESRKSTKKWGHDFVQKMIRATHGL